MHIGIRKHRQNMGNYPSKPTDQEESLDGVCDMADEAQEIKYEGDPRSPTVDIDRTPLQRHGVLKAKPITKNVDLTKECFDKCEEPMLNPALTAIMSRFDPRSPTIDFQRTPLGFIVKNPELMLAFNQLNSSNFLDGSDLHSNEMLDNSNTGIVTILEPKNLCQELYNLSVQSENDQSKVTEDDLSICDINNKTSEGNDSVDDVREHHPTPDHNATNKPIYGLLETNLDYIETDLDTVRRRRKVILKPENIIMSENSDTEKDVSGMKKDIEENKDLSGEDPRSPSVGIDRTPIIVTENRDREMKSIKSNKKPNSQMKEVFRNNVKLQKRMLSDEKLLDKNIIKKITDSLLIYEDTFPDGNNTSFNSKKGLNILSNEGSRTPLACVMNFDNSHPNSKQNTPNEQNMFDLQMKSNKATNAKSKIPVRVSKTSPAQYNTANIKCSDLKNVKSHIMVQYDSENTPPQPRKACWDTDSSVVL